jgi:serine/threonine-protein kinase
MNQAASFGSTRPIIPAGTQLNGFYEIDEPIAAGGMGEIYKGHAIQTGDIVAIKLIRSDLAEAEAAFAMFRKEASALHNLYDEAIVGYYVFTFDPVLKWPYLAMEYVDGQSLSTMLRGGPLAFEAPFSG